MFEWERIDQILTDTEIVEVRGRVTGLVGPFIRAVLPEATVGQLCRIQQPRGAGSELAEVVGFSQGQVTLMPLGDIRQVGTASEVLPLREQLTVPVGPELLGRVVDGIGRPLDGRPLGGARRYPAHAPVANPLSRPPIDVALPVGVRAIDGPLTLGEGQRVGIFAAAGVGKSTLLGMIARGTAADINVVALIGERNREVREFIEHNLGAALARTVVVVATSDQPALVRLKAAYTATAIAEYFRDQGSRVLLMMDSITRFARARREIGLASGEPVTRGGFTPSCFADLPRLFERAGRFECGSITGIYTVLVEGDDLTEPVADEVRSLLDGHIVLSSALAEGGYRPAIDILGSLSRLQSQVSPGPGHRHGAIRLRELLSEYRKNEDKIALGFYQPGNNPLLDEAVRRRGEIEGFLRQGEGETTPLPETSAFLERLARPEEDNHGGPV